MILKSYSSLNPSNAKRLTIKCCPYKLGATLITPCHVTK